MALPEIALQAARVHAYAALLAGSEDAPMHGDCENPFIVSMRGRGPLIHRQLDTIRKDPFVDWYDTPQGGVAWVPGWEADEALPPEVLTVHVKVRCRKCPACLKAKQRQWMARGIHEVRSASRTWFGTLTVGPDRRLWAKMVADKLAQQRWCEAFSDLDQRDRTIALASVLAPEVTRWLKRVRKASGVPLRYLLVSEPHGDGFPHFHLLVHEPGQPVTKRVLQEKWKYGFSQFRLVEPDSLREVVYVCKYITKSPLTRIRASRRYGGPA